MEEEGSYKKLDTEESWDASHREITQMGYLGWRPRFLECFNKPPIFATVFALGNFFMVMSYGITSLIIPILESVFNLNSKQTGVILMANDISGTIVALVIANYCSARKTRWIAAGMLVVVLSAVIPASTTLFAEYPKPRNLTKFHEIQGNGTFVVDEEAFGVCNETQTDKSFYNDPDDSQDYAVRNHKYYWMFVVGSLLQGVGNAPTRIAGSTYIDEIFIQKQFGVAISFLYVVSFLGYPAAMIFGAMFLEYYVTLDPPQGMTSASKEWVGAWWMGMFFPAVILFVFTFFVMLYPRQMPAAKDVLKDKVRRGITTVLEKKEELERSLGDITRDMLPALKRVLVNKALTCLIVGDIFLFLSVGAYSYYPKLYGLLFRLDYKSVGSIMGLTNIIGFGIGLLLSGLLMRCKEWEPKKLQLVYTILRFSAIPFSFGVFLHCPSNTYAGVDVSYTQLLNSTTSFSPLPSLNDDCNSDCACNTAFYQPVCDNDVTFFSPCHAACNDVMLDESGHVSLFTGCTCTTSGTATPGQCGQHCTVRLYISLFITSIGTIIGFSGFAAHAYIYQRVVGEVDRTFTQGIRSSVTRALGTLPAPIIFGWVIDNFCTVWRVSEDGTVGNCWVYDVDNLILVFIFLRITMNVMSCVFYLLCWWVYPDKKYSPVEEEKGASKELMMEEVKADSKVGEEKADSKEGMVEGPCNGVLQNGT